MLVDNERARIAINMRRHVVSLLLIALLATVVYFRVSLAYFCGYDDFLETRRAALVDRFNLPAVFTTPHFESFKYRPLNRALNLVTYLSHPGEALPFRLRNLFFHEVAAAAVYILAFVLFESWPAACLAALLFVIHPLANQSVDAAVWTNTTANSLFLFSLIFFLLAIRRSHIGLLILSAICAVVDVLLYEAAIMLPILMTVWWAIDCLANKRLPKFRYAAVFVLANLVLFGSYLLLRQHVIHGAKTAFTPPLSMAKGFVEYGAALLLPFDLVLANSWYRLPLPSELQTSGIGKMVLPLAVGVLALLALIVFRYRRQIVGGIAQVGSPNIARLVSAMILSILPLIVFSDHVSETYLYLPVAFFCILLGRVLLLISSANARNSIIAVLVFLFCCATWVRNERVRACGSDSRRILSTLAAGRFRNGAWTIDVAKTPGTVTPLHYGLYNYHGLDTLGSGDGGLGIFGLRGVPAAVQMKAQNPALTVNVDSPDELREACQHPAANQACFWVAPDGKVTAFLETTTRTFVHFDIIGPGCQREPRRSGTVGEGV